MTQRAESHRREVAGPNGAARLLDQQQRSREHRGVGGNHQRPLQRLRPGEEQIFNSTYMVRGDLPDGTKSLDVTYEFKVEN